MACRRMFWIGRWWLPFDRTTTLHLSRDTNSLDEKNFLPRFPRRDWKRRENLRACKKVNRFLAHYLSENVICYLFSHTVCLWNGLQRDIYAIFSPENYINMFVFKWQYSTEPVLFKLTKKQVFWKLRGVYQTKVSRLNCAKILQKFTKNV